MTIAATAIDQFRIPELPNYVAVSNEEAVFRAAFATRVPLVLKGPTGCGKTRFVEYMAHRLDVPLITVACHEDLTASDLVGRFLFVDEETVWRDGPLALAVRHGGICYLDEIVEARKDTTVVIHSLTDDRRRLYIDKTGEVIEAHPNFMVVLSYNPGYQSVVKDLKHSTRQRFASLVFDHPSLELETSIIRSEATIDAESAEQLAQLGSKLRELRGFGLEEGAGTRLLVHAARLANNGLSLFEACRVSIGLTLTDDEEVRRSVMDLIQLHFGDFLAETEK